MREASCSAPDVDIIGMTLKRRVNCQEPSEPQITVTVLSGFSSAEPCLMSGLHSLVTLVNKLGTIGSPASPFNM